jgi:hypothetical protein
MVTRPEEWRRVPGLAWNYEVSDRGRMRNTHMGRIIGRRAAGIGYVLAAVRRDDDKSITIGVHAAMLMAFVGPRPSPKHVCNHKNGIRDDNRLENLEWCTASENFWHSVNVLGKPCAIVRKDGYVPR